MNLKKKLILKNYCKKLLQKQIRTLNEDKHISDVVISETDKVAETIKNQVQSHYGANMKHKVVDIFGNSFIMNIFDKEIKIIYKIYYFKDDDCLYYAIERPINSASYNQKTNIIKINAVYINDELTNEFYGSLQHEIEHLYQKVKSQKNLISNKKSSLYDNIVRILQNEYSNEYELNLAMIAYFTFNEERCGFLNDIYGYLIHSCKNESDVDKKYLLSDGYMQFYNVYMALDWLKSISEDDKMLNDTLYNYFNGKSADWFLKNGDKAVKDFVNRLRILLSKVKNDINNKNKLE